MIGLDQYRAVERAGQLAVVEGIFNLLPPSGPIDHRLVVGIETEEVDGLPVGVGKKWTGEISLVFEHDFQGLWVQDGEIGVILSFDRVPAFLRFPSSAVRWISDASAPFAADFKPLAGPAARAANDATVVSLDAFRKERT